MMRRRHLPLALLLAAACAAPAERQPPPAQPASSQQMAQRLRLLDEMARVERNPFLNRRRAERFEQRLPPAEDPAWPRQSLRLARELLRAGRSAEAVERLEELHRRLGEAADIAFRRQVLYALAVAQLRLGEQQNCLGHHNADSCLLPIRGGGVHQEPRAVRAAAALLTELLRSEPQRLDARWLLNLAAMAAGEHPDGVPARWLIPSSAFAGSPAAGSPAAGSPAAGTLAGRFVDVAPAAGVAAEGLAGGAVVDDFDGDGALDVMVSSWGFGDPLRLFLRRRGRFEEVSEAAGLRGLTGGLNLVHADADNDGALDVLVLRGAWLVGDGRQPNSLLRNLGPGAGGVPRFADVTEAAGLLSLHPTQTAAWADFDNDGRLDLFVGNESSPGNPHPCELFRNLGPDAGGEPRFEDVAAELGVAAGGFVKGVAWGDVDNDGWPDLYVSRLLEPNLLYRNLEGRGFAELAEAAGVSEPLHSFPTWFFDVDNDGWLDLFVAGYAADYFEPIVGEVAAATLGRQVEAALPRLYRNLGAGGVAFEDITAAAGLRQPLYAMGANFGDIDNDGRLDLYLGTGAPSFDALVPNRLFRNLAGRRFADLTTAAGVGHLQKGHGVAFADLDHDGDQDLYEVLGGAYSGDVYPNALFLNPGPLAGHRWVTLRLEGRRSNRAAIGARLRLELLTPGGPRQLFRTVSSGGSFGASSLQQEVGLGDATALPRVEVRWPGGEPQVFRDLALDRAWRLIEGEAAALEEPYEHLPLAPAGARHRH